MEAGVTVTADSSDFKVTSPEVVVPTSIDNVDPLRDDPRRVNQQQVLPSAIQTRLIGNLFSNNPASFAPNSGVRLTEIIPNNSSGNFYFTLTDNQNRELIAVPDIAFYVGEVVGPDTLWPNASFGMGNMPMTVYNDWAITDNKNVVTHAIMRNNSGTDQEVTCVCRFRIIANPGTTS